jgi:hypothetical protein
VHEDLGEQEREHAYREHRQRHAGATRDGVQARER